MTFENNTGISSGISKLRHSATHLMLRLAAYPEGMLEILITPGAVAIH